MNFLSILVGLPLYVNCSSKNHIILIIFFLIVMTYEKYLNIQSSPIAVTFLMWCQFRGPLSLSLSPPALLTYCMLHEKDLNEAHYPTSHYQKVALC